MRLRRIPLALKRRAALTHGSFRAPNSLTHRNIYGQQQNEERGISKPETEGLWEAKTLQSAHSSLLNTALMQTSLLPSEKNQLENLLDAAATNPFFHFVLETKLHIPLIFLTPFVMRSAFIKYVENHPFLINPLRLTLQEVEDTKETSISSLGTFNESLCSQKSYPDGLTDVHTLIRSICLESMDVNGHKTEVEFPRDSFVSTLEKMGSKTVYKCIFLLQLLHKFTTEECAEQLIAFRNLKYLTDLRVPHEAFYSARRLQRMVYIHTGPTNSGKTYEALQQLQQAATGVYCGPLRILVYELYERLTALGVVCNLITGQEILIHKNATHICCTVEMAPIDRRLDCAVIDEVQMIGDAYRGAAWTRALLGLQAKELHLCGDVRFVSLIQRICSNCKDEVKQFQYHRLLPLFVEDAHVASLLHIREGDCVVCFSRKEIFQVKYRLESEGFNVCVVYGSLPPETRQLQGALFNDPSSPYTVLIASDAIGMGLNFNIRRIVFWNLRKFDGDVMRELTTDEIRQIAGRAGRYGFGQSEGWVTCAHKEDLAKVRSALNDIEKAGIFPSLIQFKTFCKQFHQSPTLRFEKLLQLYLDLATIDSNYFLINCKNMIHIAKALSDITLSFEDRFEFCLSPLDTLDLQLVTALRTFVQQYSLKQKVSLIEAYRLQAVLSADCTATTQTLHQMEIAYQILDLYIWLGNKFGSNIFTDITHAKLLKSNLAQNMGDLLKLRIEWNHHSVDHH